MKATAIVGRIRYTDADLYETPAWATEALIKQETFIGTILEPACGRGAISDVFLAAGFDVLSSDKYDYGYGKVRDFLKDYPQEVDNIVTNPPFNKATEFVEVSKMLATQKVAMFLKLTFLEGAARHQRLFTDTNFPLARVYVFSKRVNLYAESQDKTPKSGTIAFAWFVWDKIHSGQPEIRWIA